MSDDHEKENQPERKDRESWQYILLKILKGIGVTLGVIAVIIVLVFGLALGACFLRARR